MRVVTRLRSRSRVLPRQFWLLVAGNFVFLLGIEMCFPFETIYMNGRLGISMTTVGLILGLSMLIGLPMQIVGGAVADRFGRRAVLMLGIGASIILFVTLALAHDLWQVAAAIAIEAAFGWAMFMTANNAIIADLTPSRHRVEAFGISRTAMNVGMILGPIAGGLLLRVDQTFRLLFLVGAGVCAIFLLLVVLRFEETRPEVAKGQGAGLSAVAGYRVVLQDRHFLAFCGVSLLPLYGFGQFGVTFPVLLKNVLGISPGTWGLLLALYALAAALLQYPVVRRTRDRDKMALMAAASALIGVGLGGAAFAPAGWPTAAFVLVISVGSVLLIPISATIVSQLAPPALRGRYMGAWTLVWTAGMALGPTFGGIAMDRLGGRGAYSLILVAGLLGGALFASMRAGKVPAIGLGAVRGDKAKG
jgi:MFS family permease